MRANGQVISRAPVEHFSVMSSGCVTGGGRLAAAHRLHEHFDRHLRSIFILFIIDNVFRSVQIVFDHQLAIYVVDNISYKYLSSGIYAEKFYIVMVLSTIISQGHVFIKQPDVKVLIFTGLSRQAMI